MVGEAAVGLAHNVGEGEVDIISKSDQPLGAVQETRRCKMVPFVWASRVRTYL